MLLPVILNTSYKSLIMVEKGTDTGSEAIMNTSFVVLKI